jgi:hypothetical protein
MFFPHKKKSNYNTIDHTRKKSKKHNTITEWNRDAIRELVGMSSTIL